MKFLLAVLAIHLVAEVINKKIKAGGEIKPYELMFTDVGYKKYNIK